MKVLLTQTGFLGDVVLATPLITAIRERHPDAELWMLTTKAGAELVRGLPELAGVIAYDKAGADRGLGGMLRKVNELRAHGFAYGYSLHKSYRTAVLLSLAGVQHRIGYRDAALSFLYHERTAREGAHAVERNLALLGLADRAREFPLRLAAPRLEDLSSVARDAVGAAEIVVAPGSVWETKRWAWEHFRALIELLLAQGKTVAVVGAPEEREVCAKVCHGLAVRNLGGVLRLPDLMYLIAHARLVVCNDSLPLHIASAFKTPTVAIFCATSPKFGFGPWQNQARVVEVESLSCKPCRRHGGHVCPTGTEACMKQLHPHTVFSAVNELIGEV